MDLRNLPDGMSPIERVDERRKRAESELSVDLGNLMIDENQVGQADEKNCEQMIGAVPIPVGIAGPLSVTFSSGESADIFLPLATTEGALVASVNRGCKVLNQSDLKVESTYHGITRSIAFKVDDSDQFTKDLKEKEDEWKEAGETTSGHLKIVKTSIDTKDDHVFITINADTDEAMGMNMVTIAAQAVGEWIAENISGTFVTVAANIDSDKKPSKRTRDEGRGYEVTASAVISSDVIGSVLKSDPKLMGDAAHAKLNLGSELAGALGKNLHAANVIAALYLSTGQDPAHTVEGSLAETDVSVNGTDLKIRVRLPAILVGIRGGGAVLPAQSQALGLILKPKTSLHPCMQLAESIASAVLAGEISLLAAQASHQLTSAHRKLGR